MWLVPLLSLGLSARRLAPVGSEGASQRVLQQERAEFVRVALLTPATARSAALSLLCPIACSGMGLIGKDFDPALLSLIISTPSAFSINAAYVRRERAFVALAQLRAAAWNIHLDARRWGCGEDAAAASEAMRVVWASFIREIRVAADKCSSPDRKQQEMLQMYRDLDCLGECLEGVRRRPCPESRDDMAALSTVLFSDERMLLHAIEQVRVIASTRTPVLLRGFTISGSSLFPVLFAPYFAAVAADSPSGLPWSAYLLSLLFAVTNTALVNIQEALEDPFDGDTLDDIRLSDFEPPGYAGSWSAPPAKLVGGGVGCAPCDAAKEAAAT